MNEEVLNILRSAQFMTLGTQEQGKPHLTLMTFTLIQSPPTFEIVFATRRHTRKFVALQTDDNVCLLIHDGQFTAALAIYGKASIVRASSPEEHYKRTLHLSNHPDYKNFIEGDDIAIITVAPTDVRYCDLSNRPKQIALPPSPASTTFLPVRSYEVPYFHVNAFSDSQSGLQGNAAGIILHPPSEPCPRDADLIRAANELNLSETCILIPLQPGEGFGFLDCSQFSLRWFTPKKEVSLCGHGTLAAAHALLSQGNRNNSFTFHTLSGLLEVTIQQQRDSSPENFSCTSATLALPLNAPTPCSTNDPLINSFAIAFLGIKLSATLLKTAVYSASTKKLVIVLTQGSQEALRTLCPDMSLVMGIHQPSMVTSDKSVEGVCITCSSDVEGERSFFSRYWSPWNGIPGGEDPVNGASHTILAPFWASVWGVPRGGEMTSTVLSDRGGKLRVSVHPSEDRVLLTGFAETVCSGSLRLKITKPLVEGGGQMLP